MQFRLGVAACGAVSIHFIVVIKAEESPYAAFPLNIFCLDTFIIAFNILYMMMSARYDLRELGNS